MSEILEMALGRGQVYDSGVTTCLGGARPLHMFSNIIRYFQLFSDILDANAWMWKGKGGKGSEEIKMEGLGDTHNQWVTPPPGQMAR